MTALAEALEAGEALLGVLAEETSRLAAGEPAEGGLVATKRRMVDNWGHATARLDDAARLAPELAALANALATAATANGRALRLRIEVAESLLAGLAEEARHAAGARLVTYDGGGAARFVAARPPLARDARA